MIDLKLEIVSFGNEDVIVTSGSGFPLTAGNTYVTAYDEYIQSGNTYNYSYAFLRFMYNPGEENHMAVYGAFGTGSSASNKYTCAWYDDSAADRRTENKIKSEYGGNYPS